MWGRAPCVEPIAPAQRVPSIPEATVGAAMGLWNYINLEHVSDHDCRPTFRVVSNWCGVPLGSKCRVMIRLPVDRSSSRQILFAGLLAAGVITLIAVAHSCAGSIQQARLAEAVPDFYCPDLRMTTSGATVDRSGRQLSGSSRLDIPVECRARLLRIVTRHPFFEEDCGQTSRCWSVQALGRRYSFEFADRDVYFRFDGYGTD